MCLVFGFQWKEWRTGELALLFSVTLHHLDVMAFLTWVPASPPPSTWWGRARIWKRCRFHRVRTRGCTWLCPGHFSNGPAGLLAPSPAGGGKSKQSGIINWQHSKKLNKSKKHTHADSRFQLQLWVSAMFVSRSVRVGRFSGTVCY